MSRKINAPKISQVIYFYSGTDEEFNYFLKAVVLVKDLSRLGREKIQTAMFIEYLRSHNIRVISATDNTDSFNEDDEFRMDMNQFINQVIHILRW